MTKATVSWLIVIAAFVWYILCQFVSSRMRHTVREDLNTVPTATSNVLWWLALIGVILILAVGQWLLLTWI